MSTDHAIEIPRIEGTNKTIGLVSNVLMEWGRMAL